MSENLYRELALDQFRELARYQHEIAQRFTGSEGELDRLIHYHYAKALDVIGAQPLAESVRLVTEYLPAFLLIGLALSIITLGAMMRLKSSPGKMSLVEMGVRLLIVLPLGLYLVASIGCVIVEARYDDMRITDRQVEKIKVYVDSTWDSAYLRGQLGELYTESLGKIRMGDLRDFFLYPVGAAISVRLEDEVRRQYDEMGGDG